MSAPAVHRRHGPRLAATAALVLLAHAWLIQGGQLSRPQPPLSDAPSPVAPMALRLVPPSATAVPMQARAMAPAHGADAGLSPGAPWPVPDRLRDAPPAPARAAQAAVASPVQPATAPAATPAPAAAAPPPTVDLGSARDAPEPAIALAEPLPLYQPLLPDAAELHFDASRGTLRGRAVLAWAPQGDRYELALTVTPDEGRGAFRQHSRGELGANGLAPHRFIDGRAGRGERAVSFRRDEGLLSFSASADRLPLPEGLQDRLAWLVQLVGVVNARRAAGQPLDEPVVLGVAGLRGGLARWVFTAQTGPAGHPPGLTLVREAEGPYDTRVELVLEAAAPHWPLWLRYTEARGEPLLLVRRAQSATP
jgi:hypothetical protein